VDGALDVADDFLALVLTAGDEQPARALRDVARDEQDADRQDGTEPDVEAPPDRGADDRGSSSGMVSSEPAAAPTQNEPLAPMQAPATYAEPAKPMSELLNPRPVLAGLRASEMDPTMVTSSPSRIQTCPAR
jgi:hypothetical protein